MKVLVTVFVLILFSLVAAQSNPAVAITSAEVLEGALEANFDSVVTQYVPGYGLQVNARWLGDFDEANYLTTVSGVVTGLSSLIQGLAQDDVVSVSYSLRSFGSEPSIYYTVRVIPGQADSLEVFVNGLRQ